MLLASLILVVAAACGHPAQEPAPAAPQAIDGMLPGAQGIVAANPPDPHAHLSSGVSLAPIRISAFIFGPNDPSERVQAASLALAQLVPDVGRLQIRALPSPAKTAALDVLEVSTPRLKWGDLLIPAERKFFRAFAADPSMGDWLVIVDDVKVEGGPDPIPVTAYIWPRSDVVSYWRCGIPASAMDACTSDFYLKADTMVVTQAVPGHSH